MFLKDFEMIFNFHFMVLKGFAPGASKMKTAIFKRMIHYRPLNMIENCTPNVTKAWKDFKVRFVPTGLR